MEIPSPGALPVAAVVCGLLCLWIFSRYLTQHNESSAAHNSEILLREGYDSEDHPVTVIIPALNEDAVLAETIDNLLNSCILPTRTAPTVVVVVAGSHSNDNTEISRLKSRRPTVRFESYTGPPSRGGQQNYGAKLAKSLVVLFLHADTLLPKSWDAAILSVLTTKGAPAIGAFSLSLPGSVSLQLRIMLWGANARARYGGLPYGDQAYFLLRSTFESVGGFPDVPIMEDVSLLRRIKQHGGGKPAILSEPVQTSPRRWVKNGMVWNTILNQLLMTAWLCGVSPERIYVWYYGQSPELMVSRMQDKSK